MGKRILLVDDEPLILKGLKYQLEMDGYETELAMDGEEALGGKRIEIHCIGGGVKLKTARSCIRGNP